jgi:cysteine desulfurase
MTYIPYLDCCATSPIETEVLDEIHRYLAVDFGNSGSRTHDYGAIANRGVEQARRSVAQIVACDPTEVIFTSGATESDNLAILGLAEFGSRSDRCHIVSTAIEHKAVLEPLEQLRERGFEITLIAPDKKGRVSAQEVLSRIRGDTLLVSVMHANNETGVIQPIAEIAEGLSGSEAYFHTDAAQTFGRLVADLRNPRIDLISISGHKIFGPKGIGALITRRRNGHRPPLTPLMFGGGQERGLRPGTMPVALVAGLGKAAEIASRDYKERDKKCREFRQTMLQELSEFQFSIHGDDPETMSHVVNISFGDIDSEALMLSLKNVVAISNGSACTSATYSPSHVLTAMQLDEQEVESATRWSWCHLTEQPDWEAIRNQIRMLK